jgi:hypothetical protein
MHWCAQERNGIKFIRGGGLQVLEASDEARTITVIDCKDVSLAKAAGLDNLAFIRATTEVRILSLSHAPFQG